VVVDGSWVDLITRVDGTFFLERQGFASFLHKTITRGTSYNTDVTSTDKIDLNGDALVNKMGTIL